MNFRSLLIRAVTFLGGLYFFLKFVLPAQTGFDTYHEQISDGFVLVGAMALALGLINLLMVHGSRVLYLRKGWVPSVALLVGLFSMLLITIIDWRNGSALSSRIQQVLILKDFSERIVSDAGAGNQPIVEGRTLTPQLRNEYLQKALEELLPRVYAEQGRIRTEIEGTTDQATLLLHQRSDKEFAEAYSAVNLARATLIQAEETPFDSQPNLTLSAALSQLGAAYRGLLNAEYRTSFTKHLYDLLFEGLFISLGAAMFSLLGFYICAAAYRAFRVRSMESLLMMSAALLVMLGQIPFGLWISESLPEIRLWLLQVPSTGAARAIEMGASVAGLIMAFRMWLSIESESFS